MMLSERVRRQLRCGVLCLIAVCVVGIQSAYAEKKVTVPPAEFPANIREAVMKKFPDGQIVTVEKETEGADAGQYDVLVKSVGHEYDVEVTAAGVIKETVDHDKATAAAATADSKANSSIQTWGLVVFAVGVLWWGFRTKKAPPNPRGVQRRK
ncbi:hypothetical protein BH09SUM1_BH09SUM1_24000 [soil metagenome]